MQDKTTQHETITLSHGRATHAASQWEMAKNLTHTIRSMSGPRTPNFIKFGGTRASRHNGEMYTSHTLETFFYRFLARLYSKRNTQQFQALNDLNVLQSVTQVPGGHSL